MNEQEFWGKPFERRTGNKRQRLLQEPAPIGPRLGKAGEITTDGVLAVLEEEIEVCRFMNAERGVQVVQTKWVRIA